MINAGLSGTGSTYMPQQGMMGSYHPQLAYPTNFTSGLGPHRAGQQNYQGINETGRLSSDRLPGGNIAQGRASTQYNGPMLRSYQGAMQGGGDLLRGIDRTGVKAYLPNGPNAVQAARMNSPAFDPASLGPQNAALAGYMMGR